MNRSSLVLGFVVALAAPFLAARPAYAEEAPVTPAVGAREAPCLNLSMRGEYGSLGAAGSGYLLGLEGELDLSKGFSLSPMLLLYEYGRDVDDEEAAGWGAGPALEARFYPIDREALSGFYFGLGVGVLFGAYTWEGDDDGDGEIGDDEEERGDATSVIVSNVLGYLFRPTEALVIGPTAIAGYYLTSAPDGSGVFAGIGLKIGLSF